MSRARLIPPEFWTTEAVIDCAPMTRLLLLGLSNFADDFGALPLRPRTIRLQVFPGDALDDEQVRAMIEELAARGLVRRYTVEGVEYLSIVDWEIHQRVGRHARRRYPACPPETPEAATPAASPEAPDHGKPWQSSEAAPEASPLPAPSESLGPCAEAEHSDPPPAADEAAAQAVCATCDPNQQPHPDPADAAVPAALPIAMAQPMANHSNRTL